MFSRCRIERNKTFGEFCTDVTIDGNYYQMKIHVISGTLMQDELLIGTDFLILSR